MTEVLRVPIVKIVSELEPGSRWHKVSALGAVLMATVFGMTPAVMAAPQDKPAAQDKSAGAPDHLFGEYLAGRHAQQRRDFSGAAKWFEKAIVADPDAPEVISRSFLMEVSVGHLDRALALAAKELRSSTCSNGYVLRLRSGRGEGRLECLWRARRILSAAIPILNKTMAQMETEDGWVGLGTVGQRLANIASDFDPRSYGYRKLSDLVRKTGAFEIDQPEGRAMRIRAKPKPASKTRTKATPPGETTFVHQALCAEHRFPMKSYPLGGRKLGRLR